MARASASGLPVRRTATWSARRSMSSTAARAIHWVAGLKKVRARAAISA